MEILKNEIKENFTMIPNSIIREKTLSDGDFRLLMFLYSLPSNWKITQTFLAKEMNCNERNLRFKISRLKEAGYLEIIKNNNDFIYCLREKDRSLGDLRSLNDRSLGDLYKNTNIYKESNNINIITKESKKFIKPTIEEIRKYCEERKNGIDPESFYDFYESKDWYIGKNKMKDFKSAIRTWERNRKSNEKEIIPEWFNKPIEKGGDSKYDELAEQLTKGTWRP